MVQKLLLLFIMLLLIQGCVGKIFSDKSMFAPKPFRMREAPKDAHPDYVSGWEDGCQTGLSTMVTGYYKSFYAYKQDPYMVNNPMYYKAWKDAYTYCRHYSFRFTWDAIDKKRKESNICVLCPNELR